MSSPEADRAALEAVHAPAHVEMIERAAAGGGAQLDPDTVVSEGSFEAALHAAGGAVALADRLLDGSASTGFSAHRPPATMPTAGGRWASACSTTSPSRLATRWTRTDWRGC